MSELWVRLLSLGPASSNLHSVDNRIFIRIFFYAQVGKEVRLIDGCCEAVNLV
jgi:hypothetical protein